LIRANPCGVSAFAAAAFVLLTSASSACTLREGAQSRPAAPPAQRVAQRFEQPARGAILIECWTEDPERLVIVTHDGADVRAAVGGEALFAGSFGRVGPLILIRHPNGFTSAYYGDIGELRVKRHDHVNAGQVIAAMRASNELEAPRLRFELSAGRAAVDPRPYLDPSAP
jgi:septal ring factor EnvC (AmiA/AmiB activator)